MRGSPCFLGREGPASSTSPHSQAPDRVGGARRPSCRGGRTRACLMKASRLYTKKALKVLKMAQKRRLTWCLFAQLFAGLKVRISLSRHPARIGSQFRPCEARNTTNQCATPPVLCTRVRADSNKVTHGGARVACRRAASSGCIARGWWFAILRKYITC